ncbi:hypothetical protein FIBSPDRAFT_889620 [Athelia psychrophila]|uniref:Uncharacterized protein n=1 Tax=Athelia psychrophila TaxID=1759441 RepID=A0A166M0S2_9AGAM|nr:hypothetical protein FIBSPDRAFT_889620 [Fibularhizoctonia sp. CBS 109695]
MASAGSVQCLESFCGLWYTTIHTSEGKQFNQDSGGGITSTYPTPSPLKSPVHVQHKSPFILKLNNCDAQRGRLQPMNFTRYSPTSWDTSNGAAAAGMGIARPDSDSQLGDLQPDSHTNYEGQVGDRYRAQPPPTTHTPDPLRSLPPTNPITLVVQHQHIPHPRFAQTPPTSRGCCVQPSVASAHTICPRTQPNTAIDVAAMCVCLHPVPLPHTAPALHTPHWSPCPPTQPYTLPVWPALAETLQHPGELLGDLEEFSKWPSIRERGCLKLVGDDSEALGQIISRHGKLHWQDGARSALLVMLVVVVRMDRANVGKRLLALAMSKLVGSDGADSISVIIVIIIGELFVPSFGDPFSTSTNSHSRGDLVLDDLVLSKHTLET